MTMLDLTLSPALGARPATYAEWVRAMMRRGAPAGTKLIPLFDSSMPEPTALLAELIADAFAAPVDPRFASTFAGGNPFVLARLAQRLDVSRERILCTTGATGALAMLYRSLSRPGDHVLVETPGFDLFTGLALEAGLEVGFVRRPGPDFAIDIDGAIAAVTSRTRMIVVSNLHNPSGAAIPHATLTALAARAGERGVLLVVDEVYGDYADADTRPCHAAAIAPNVVGLGSFTKIYGLHAVRCGWIVAAPGVMDRIRCYSEKFDFGISNLAHAAAALVLDNVARFDRYKDDILCHARPVIVDRLTTWQQAGLTAGVPPPFGCIAFPRIVHVTDTAAFAERLFARSGVLVAPGEYFGAPGHIRIGFAQSPDRLRASLDALAVDLHEFADSSQPA